MALLVLAATMGFGAPPALACSCIESTIDDALFDTPIVFVGEKVASQLQEERRLLGFEVESVLRGEVTAQTVVQTGGEYDSCGEPNWATAATSDPIVVLAYPAWDDPSGLEQFPQVGVCVYYPSVDELTSVLDGELAAPDGEGPVAAVVSLRHRWASLVALDVNGRVLAWGSGRQAARLLPCVDSPDHIVELRWDGADLRDLTTMKIVASTAIENLDVSTAEASCILGADGPVLQVGPGPGGATGSTDQPTEIGTVTISAENPWDLGPGEDPRIIATDGAGERVVVDGLGKLMPAQILALADGPTVDPIVPPPPPLLAPSDGAGITIDGENPPETDPPVDPDPGEPDPPTDPDESAGGIVVDPPSDDGLGWGLAAGIGGLAVLVGVAAFVVWALTKARRERAERA